MELTPYFDPIKKIWYLGPPPPWHKKMAKFIFHNPNLLHLWNLMIFLLVSKVFWAFAWTLYRRHELTWSTNHIDAHIFSPFGAFLECYLEMSCAKGWLSMSMVSSLFKYGICKWVQPRWKCHLDKFSKLQISLFIPFMKLYVQVLDGLLCFFFFLSLISKCYIYICNYHRYY